MAGEFRRGDLVVFHLQDSPQAPETSVAESEPEERLHHLDRFWTVVAVSADGQLVLKNQSGTECDVSASSDGLRRASWWELLFHRRQFSMLLRATSHEDAAEESAVENAAATTSGDDTNIATDTEHSLQQTSPHFSRKIVRRVTDAPAV